MEYLWAPWRLSYVAAAKAPSPDDPCFICQGLNDGDDRRNLIPLRTPLSVVVLNRYPYNNGHLLIAPRAHKATLADLDATELLETMETLRRMVALLERLLHGFNIGLNLGQSAGAGLPGHLHWHVVPRWHGDTNFMPVIGETKVIVQSLDALYDLLVSNLTGRDQAAGSRQP
jgi:ATP adenylyltransferase